MTFRGLPDASPVFHRNAGCKNVHAELCYNTLVCACTILKIVCLVEHSGSVTRVCTGQRLGGQLPGKWGHSRQMRMILFLYCSTASSVSFSIWSISRTTVDVSME